MTEPDRSSRGESGCVATVEVNRRSGQLRVKHFAVVRDCGQIISPDGVKNQIEGNILQTVSRTLKEEIAFNRSQVTSVDWVSYPILTFPEIPDVDIELIDRPTGELFPRVGFVTRPLSPGGP
jgi:CO/xanthine dehydrogenase Mo-binding subunit